MERPANCTSTSRGNFWRYASLGILSTGAFTLQTLASAPGLTTGGPSDPTTAGQRVVVKLTGTGTITAPPVVKGMAVWATLKRRQFEQRTYRAVFSKGLRQANAAQKSRDPMLDLEQLKILAGNSADGDPFTFRDEFGQTWTAEVVNGIDLSEDLMLEGTGGTPDWVTVATFTVRLLDQIVLYDAGYLYDSGVTYPAE